MPFFLEAAILSRIRSPVTSRSNWAKDSRTFRVSRPMLVVVLNDWVTETKDTPWASNNSTSLAVQLRTAGRIAHYRSARLPGAVLPRPRAPLCHEGVRWRLLCANDQFSIEADRPFSDGLSIHGRYCAQRQRLARAT